MAFIAFLAVVCVALLTTMSPAHAAGTVTPVDDYPAHLRDAPMDSIIDQWGMPNRQCTSYVAWRLHRDGVRFTRNRVLIDIMMADDPGPLMAAIGGRVDNTPEVGAIIHWTLNEEIFGPDSEADSKFLGFAGGTIGHFAYIEAINPDGSVRTSEYNVGFPEGVWRTRNVYLWTGRVLHFPAGEPLGPPPAPPVDQPAPPTDQPEPVTPPADEPPAVEPPDTPKAPAVPPSKLVCTMKPVRGGGGRAGRVTLTDTQMRTNQRISIEALRRATALLRKADGRPPLPTAATKATSKKKAAKVRLTTAQLRTNYRIGRAALTKVRQAERKLTGKTRRDMFRGQLPTGKPTLRAMRADQRLAQEALQRVASITCTRR